MGRVVSDVQFALRNLRRSPLFTFVAVGSLALGIGANTAIFTLVDQLLLRLLPVKNPAQLVLISATGPHMGNNRGARASSYPMYEDFQRKAAAFSYVFCRYSTPLSLSFNGQTERVNAELVSGNYFQALGVNSAIGRVFSPEQDDRTYKGHPTAVLSYGYWTTRFNGDASVIGQKIVVNDYPMTIVGVSAAGFNGLDPATSPQIRVPIQMKPLMTPGWDEIGNRRSQWIQTFARMKPGYTVESAKASLQPLFSQILREEMAMRLALGASRAQLLVQLMVESLLLAAAGAAIGLFLAEGMVRALLSFLPSGGSPLMLTAEPDTRILFFNAAVALIAGLLFGLAPALQSMRLDLWTTLKDTAAAAGGTGGSARLRKALVTAQVAFSFLLLIGAGLFVKTLINLKSAHTGFQGIDNLITFQVDPALNGYTLARLRAFYTRALEQIRALPGVRSAGYATVPLLGGGEWDSTLGVEGHVAKDGEDMQAYMNSVSPGYWKTMGIPLLEGRDFDSRDAGKKTTVAIVNRKFAEHFFGSNTPIGRHVGFGDGPKSKREIEIVGVVENTLYEGPRDGVERQVFVPFLESD